MNTAPLTATVEHVLSEPRPDVAVTVTADLGSQGRVTVTFDQDVPGGAEGVTRRRVAESFVGDAAALVRRVLDGKAREA